jgi:GlpG protein
MAKEPTAELPMNDEAPPTPDTANHAVAPSTAATTASSHQPWISRLAVVVCLGVFLGLAMQNNNRSLEALSKVGYLPADAIWHGGYWALVSSAFVHCEIWHVVFNVYWLWVLGSRMERAIGSLPFLGFFVLAAFVSSSFQLAVSDTTGIGASGVAYALFGFMWATRHRYPQFSEVLDAPTIRIFFFWLVGCVVATYLEIWKVGNAAHISGLLFGLAVAGSCFVLRYPPRLVRAGLIGLVVCSIIPLFWCPWSVAWLSRKAFDAHAAGRYEAALDRYAQIIRRDPDNAWAYLNRSSVREALGDPEGAQADLRKARAIDPSIEEAK